jgi:hypothetical protein
MMTMKKLTMIPVGYLAKRIVARPECMDAPAVVDIYSLSNHMNDDFCDYINFWKHNGYWLFDSPALIEEVALEAEISLQDCTMLYFEAYEMQWDSESKSWQHFKPEESFVTNVMLPVKKVLLGYDVVTYTMASQADCSPLSCNNMASEIPVNTHCLIESFEAVKEYLEKGAFDDAEPGPYRIVAVYEIE